MKNPKFLVYIIAALVGLMIAACFCSCKHEITKGVISKKIHRPMATIATPIMCGKTVIISTTVMPESWALVVKDGSQEECFDVSREVYNKTTIGDSIRFEQ